MPTGMLLESATGVTASCSGAPASSQSVVCPFNSPGRSFWPTPKSGNRGPVELADLFARQARRRVEDRFAAVFDNDDEAAYAVAQQVIRNEHTWLEQGMVRLADDR
jgi:hypothetical protein